MSKNLKIRPYARLITMLGDQLIKNEIIALVELIKNSYDADASWVKVSFSNNIRIVKAEDVEVEKDSDFVEEEMEELIKKLKAYAELYRKEPYGREVEGTAELLEEAAAFVQEAKESVGKMKKRYMDGIPVDFEGDDADDEIQCPYCGYGVARNDDYADMKPKHCPECGTKLIY